MFVFSKGAPSAASLIQEKTKYAMHDKVTLRKKDGELIKPKYEFGKETRAKGNIWSYDVGFSKSTSDDIAFVHPATFPEKLAEDHIVSWSNEGDIVYDCFGGSGTTAKMAHKWKRNWILSEISAEYCELAEKRLHPYLSQTTLF